MVEVAKPKEKEDPLDKLTKLTSIGVSAASLAGKFGGGEAADPNGHLKTGIKADNPDMSDAMKRRMGKISTSYA